MSIEQRIARRIRTVLRDLVDGADLRPLNAAIVRRFSHGIVEGW